MQSRTTLSASIAAAALGWLAACGGSGTSSDATAAGEPAGLAGITSAHNQVRAGVDTGGTSGALPALTWDDSLAASASAWANQCKDSDGDGLIDHNPDRSNGQPYYVGENIFASSGSATAGGAVKGWADEASHYHYDTNTCDDKAVCGHYTQLVWRDTLQLGCAIAFCSGLTYSSVIVCDYGPGGNVNNEKPY